jgi:hypothetical protein
MSRSRLVFFVIIGAAILVVVGVTLISPQLQNLSASQSATATAQYTRDNITTIRVSYGTEKERWFKDAVARFQAANPAIKIELVGQGSMEGYLALSQATDANPTLGRGEQMPTLYSPASSIQVNLLNSVTKNSLSRDLAVDCKRLVISPTVIMVWEDRAKVFDTYYKDKGGITFANLIAALDPQGEINGKWEKLGGSSRWGLIKVGHTHPMESNSGTMILITLANNFYQKVGAVSVAEITDDKFVNWLKIVEQAVTVPLIRSTGLLADDVIAKGPASYDFVLVYEALAIEHYKNAVGRHGQPLRIVYPTFNMYTDHPLCVIDHPAITQRQREAAHKFQEFLLTPEIQKLALTYGWRPGDPTIPIFGAGSAFDSADLKTAGVSADVGQELRVPDGNTINQLLTVWRRNASQ